MREGGALPAAGEVGVMAGEMPRGGEAAAEARAVVGVPSSGVVWPVLGALAPAPLFFWSASDSMSLRRGGRRKRVSKAQVELRLCVERSSVERVGHA